MRAISQEINQVLLPSTYEYGKLFEQMVICEFFRLNQYIEKNWKFSYLRTGAGVEIDLIKGWPHKETFKPWTRAEMETLLRFLPTLPAWAEISDYQFYRAIKSETEDNPASSEIIHKSIILYDSFFLERNKSTIVVHEAAHNLYQKIGEPDKNTFKYLSGWHQKVDLQTRNVSEYPPRKLIKPDSSTSIEEDFTKHIEEFFESPKGYQASSPLLHKFFIERLKK